MKKKIWLIAVVAVAAALLVGNFIRLAVPQSLERLLEFPDGEPTVINGIVVGDVFSPIVTHRTDDAQTMAQVMELLRALEMKYVSSSDVYHVSDGESIRVGVRFTDGSVRSFSFSVGGSIRCNDKNYFCDDKAALKELAELVKSWEVTHVSE